MNPAGYVVALHHPSGGIRFVLDTPFPSKLDAETEAIDQEIGSRIAHRWGVYALVRVDDLEPLTEPPLDTTDYARIAAATFPLYDGPPVVVSDTTTVYSDPHIVPLIPDEEPEAAPHVFDPVADFRKPLAAAKARRPRPLRPETETPSGIGGEDRPADVTPNPEPAPEPAPATDELTDDEIAELIAGWHANTERLAELRRRLLEGRTYGEAVDLVRSDIRPELSRNAAGAWIGRTIRQLGIVLEND